MIPAAPSAAVDLVEPGLVEVGEKHRRARGAEPGGEPASDAARRAGDDRDAACEREQRAGLERVDPLAVGLRRRHESTSSRATS